MGRYDDEAYNTPSNRQRDLVLAANEFTFVQTKTDGAIKTHVGPITVTIAAQESLVIFDKDSKRFVETTNFEQAKQLFVSPPVGWYAILKNPAKENRHPEAGKPNISQELSVGKKINIPGPANFALYPGQMAKVIQGHKLRSNQYLIARVYDAAAANENINKAIATNEKGEEVEISNNAYVAGQLLIIKGTEVAFYIPPTGIEVVPQTPYGNDYVREAVTLERLEYTILKDEDGEKRYVHGPAVVFPKPTETFMTTEKGGVIFRALELSPISGIYIKVIAEYNDEIEKDGKKTKIHHNVGEELFITGNDQMIYYPRPEHAMIQYDGKYMHHAIAIPKGEGRYILNRLTGEITTVTGPKMYLPDPRKEVVVKRKLTRSECELFYPGNAEVITYNEGLNEKSVERAAKNGSADKMTDKINNAYSTANQEKTLAIFEANANISRGTSYTKPRTITLDTKYDGVVTINVWTSYAVNVISKTGKREVIVGPATKLLDYDETLEAIELSTGKPKKTDNLIRTVYLRINNNKVTDIISVQTKDFVDVNIKLSYDVDFLEKYKDKWFSANNYVKLLCDKMSSLIKREVKKYSIEEFYSKSTDIIRNIVLNLDASKQEGERTGRLFTENGMFVYDCEVLDIVIEKNVQTLLEQHQMSIVKNTLELSEATKNAETIKKLAQYEKEKIELENENKVFKEKLAQEQRIQLLENQATIDQKKREEEKVKRDAEAALQEVLNAITDAQLARNKKEDEAKIANEKEIAAIEKSRQDAYAETVAKIMESIDDKLVAALNSKSNADMLAAVTQAMSPYAMAKGESVADVTNTLLRGTTLDGVVDAMSKQK